MNPMNPKKPKKPIKSKKPMKSIQPVKKSILVFYIISVIIFWAFEWCGVFYTPEWKDVIPVWGMVIVGIFAQIAAIIFVCVGVSAILYGIFTVKSYKLKAFIPAGLIILTAGIYILLPHPEEITQFNMTYGNIRYWMNILNLN